MSDIPLILEKGRPTVEENRSKRELSAYDFLDSLGVDYYRVDHEAAMTMAACEEIDKTLGTAMCKNLFLSNRQGTAFYLLLLPGDKPFVTKQVSKALGVARLSFGSYDKMEALLGVAPGSVTVLGLLNDKGHEVQLLIDKEVLAGAYVGCHPLVNTASLKIKIADLLKSILPATGHTPILLELPRGQE